MTDYVALARAHWGPRFVAHGVPYQECERVLAAIDTWDQWCAAWSQAAAPYEERGRVALREGYTVTAEQHLSIASVMYHFAKFVYVQDMEQLRTAHGRSVECATLALPLHVYPGTRVEVPYEGTSLVGVLRLPREQGPHPVVVLVAGVDSTKEELRHLEPLFLDRGMATFSFDGPGQGEAEYDIPIRADYEVAGSAVLDVLERLPAVDHGRIGLWGVSLGGYYAPRIASADKRVTACVAVSGPFDIGARLDSAPPLTRDVFRTRSHSVDDEHLASLVADMTLAHLASSISCPLLVVAGRQDRLVPWQEQQRLHQLVVDSEFVLYDEGNHVCANISEIYRPAAADWLRRQLG